MKLSKNGLLVASQPRQRGVTSIEYALIGSLIAMVIIVGLTAVGDGNEALWSRWITAILDMIP